MRAAVISELGRPPEITDLPEPAGEAIYEVSAVALNPLDINVGAGRYFAGHPELPYVPGCEGVGRAPDGTRVYLFGDGLGLSRDGLLAERGALGRDHADQAFAGGLHRGLRAGADDADQGQVENLTRLVERGRGGRVAGDHHHLHVARLQVPDDVEGKGSDLALEARSVGEVEQVADVDRGLVGKALPDRAQHGKTADAAVEDPDRPVVAGHRPTLFRPGIPGARPRTPPAGPPADGGGRPR